MTLGYHRFAVLILALVIATTTVRAQWQEVALPAPYNGGYYLDVSFLPNNSSYGWVCSLEGFVVRTTDRGQTWRGSAIPRAFLESIQFLTPLIGYTSGPSGIYRSIDGGVSWQDITPSDPNNEKGWGCFWLNQNDGFYFVGGCATGQQAFYRTTNAGGTWVASYGNEPLSGLSDGVIDRTGRGYAVSSGVIWKTTDFGRTWRIHARTGAKTWSEEIAVFGRSFLVPSSGTDCDGQNRGVGALRFSSDYGASWKEFQTRANMFGTFLLDERRGWGVGDNRAVYYTEDYGATWELRNCGIRANIDDIYFITDTLGWAVGNGIYRSNFNAVAPNLSIEPTDDIVGVCSGDSVFVEAVGNFTTFSWDDGSTAKGRFLKIGGRYVVTAFDSVTCTTAYDTLRVRVFPVSNPRIHATVLEFCEGDSIELLLAGDYKARKWSTSENTESIVVKSGGTYTCTVVDSNNCTATASVNVIERPFPKPVIIPNGPLVFCRTEIIQLSTSESYRSYQWSTGDVSRTTQPTQSGKYAVAVVDQNGCVGISDSVSVTIIDAENKIEVLGVASNPSNTIEIPAHQVGDRECYDVRIRNVSLTDRLIIGSGFFQENVLFSIPQAQFPIAIEPGSLGVLRLCASAIDTGMIADTLVLPDTCSMVHFPVYSRGTPIMFAGSSRCDVDVDVVVVRAGKSWVLSRPFPQPARATLSVRAYWSDSPQLSARLVDVTGTTVAIGEKQQEGTDVNLLCRLDAVSAGPYYYIICIDNLPVQSFPVTVIR